MRTTIFSTTANTDMIADFLDAAGVHAGGLWGIVAVRLETAASPLLGTTDF
jgi:hypothetical protein